MLCGLRMGWLSVKSGFCVKRNCAQLSLFTVITDHTKAHSMVTHPMVHMAAFLLHHQGDSTMTLLTGQALPRASSKARRPGCTCKTRSHDSMLT